MKVTPEQQLHFLERDVLPLIEAVCNGYDYDPGSSDLDDEQPANISIPLGEYRRARRLYYELTKEDLAIHHIDGNVNNNRPENIRLVRLREK